MWSVAGGNFDSRLLLGTALYTSPHILQSAITAASCEIVTVSLRRLSPESRGGERFWSLIKDLGIRVLPNTAGCRTANEAVATAQMAREIFATNWIKLEVIGDDYTLESDPFELVEAARQLVKEGFEVFPYTTADLVPALRLVDAGCKIVMPWAAPIGTGLGPTDLRMLETLRCRLPETTLIVDAGLGKPSHAAQVMELGFDAVLLNSAVALADDPVRMARAFALAVESGYQAALAGPMKVSALASPTTPVIGTPFWQQKQFVVANN